MKKNLPAISIGFVVGFLFVWSAMSWLNTPDVEFSYSTKQCVRVIQSNGTELDCSTMPRKYNRVWIK